MVAQVVGASDGDEGGEEEGCDAGGLDAAGVES